jgi:hypothetical protein
VFWRNARPTISPFGSHRFLFRTHTIFESPRDFLIPIKPYDCPPDPPPGDFRKNTYAELLYLRVTDIVKNKVPFELEDWEYLNYWRINDHPFIRALPGAGSPIAYLLLPRVWWYILNPYDITATEHSEERVQVWKQVARWPRRITNPVTLKVVQNLRTFNHT